jgi:L-alanine-DL-glutamate epimerase-like enolase superfamily enzyme
MFRDLLEQRAVGIIQPDCSHVGGISNMMTIARMAEVGDLSWSLCAISFLRRTFPSPPSKGL